MVFKTRNSKNSKKPTQNFRITRTWRPEACAAGTRRRSPGLLLLPHNGAVVAVEVLGHHEFLTAAATPHSVREGLILI